MRSVLLLAISAGVAGRTFAQASDKAELEEYALFVDASKDIQRLIAATSYDEAIDRLGELRGFESLVSQKMKNIELLIELKARIIERVNSAGEKPKLKRIAPGAKFSGTIVSADEKGLFLGQRGMQISIPWRSLSASSYYQIACHFVGTAEGQTTLELAVLAFECGELGSARRRIARARQLGVDTAALERRLELHASYEQARMTAVRRERDPSPAKERKKEPSVILPMRALVGYWPLDHVAGRKVLDKSGRGNNGSIAGKVVADTGVRGGCFDVSEGQIEVPWRRSMNFEGSFTAELWLRADKPVRGSSPGVIGVASNLHGALFTARHGGFSIRAHSYGISMELWQPGIGSGQVRLRVPGGLPVGEWVHVAGVLDTDAKEARLYLNGELRGRSETDVIFKNNMYDGMRISGTTVPFFGVVDEIRLWSAALSGGQIAHLVSARPRR